MIKKHQKWIALIVTLTFVWLLQVSTMPLAAGVTSEQIASADAEQGPNFVERTGVAGPVAAKKSVLPYVLIGVGVVAVAAVLFLVVLKTDYDITGSWDFSFVLGSETMDYTIVFSGSQSAGTFHFLEIPSNTGPYTVDGKNVAMTFNNYPAIEFTGQFTGKDKMSGTLNDGGKLWNWVAVRFASASTDRLPAPAQAKRFPR